MSVLVGRPAPDFTAAAVLGNGEIVDSFTLSEHIKGKTAVVFFYPLDFTFVCPTELVEFNNNHAKFEELNAELYGASTDTQEVHLAWKSNDPRLANLAYPMI